MCILSVFSIVGLPGLSQLSTLIMSVDQSSPTGNNVIRPYWMTSLQKTALNLDIIQKAGDIGE